MASVQPVERAVDIDGNQSEIIPTTANAANTDSVIVKVETPNSVAYTLVTLATVVMLPLLLATMLISRLFQFVTKPEYFEKLVKFRFLLRYWLFVDVVLLLTEAGIFYPIAKYSPGLKLVVVIGLSIPQWLNLICILIGIYLIHQFIFLITIFFLSLVTLEDAHLVFFKAFSEVVGCLLVWWAESVVMKQVHTFKQLKISELPAHKWIEVSLFVLIGYNIILVLTHLIVLSLPKVVIQCCNGGGDSRFGQQILLPADGTLLDRFNNKHLVYIAHGIKRSLIFILTALLLLLTWVLYFGQHLDKKPEARSLLKFGTWTLFSVLACACLWFIKACILLYWETHAVYIRLQTKIADIGKQLYFLVLLSHTHFRVAVRYSPPKDSEETAVQSCPPKDSQEIRSYWVLKESDEDTEYCSRKSVRNKILKETGAKTSTYALQQAAEVFLKAKYTLSEETIFSNIDHLQSDNSADDNNGNVDDVLKKIVVVENEDFAEEDWKTLRGLLGVHTTEKISLQRIKTWMERAHSRCRFLANTLSTEKEVVMCLNHVLSWAIVGATFLMWLLITGLATTNVLVIIASPLLAETFIFGDTCKNLFQGLIFIYVVHPFHVGDLCLVDDKLMEVKTIGVWSTTFAMVRTVGKRQDVIYPNSELATKNVINHKTEFDWNDYIEFTLTSPKDETTKNLKQQIETYLDTEKEKFTPAFHSVAMLEIGDNAKIAVHFKHTVRSEGWTYFECLKEKEKRRFEFALYVQNLVNQQAAQKTNIQDVLSSLSGEEVEEI